MRVVSPPRSWPLGLLGMLAMTAGVERWVSRHEYLFTTLITSAWTRAREASKNAAECRVVCFGDSLVKYGVVPAALERRTGLPAYNLAVPKGQAPGNYFQLRGLLRQGARPSALVVDGELLSDDPRDQTRAWPELLGVAECAEFAWAARDPRFFAATALARALPTLRVRPDVRTSVVAALAGKTPDEVMALPVFWRQWKRNRGGQFSPPGDDAAGSDPRPGQLEREGYRPSSWACHPLNAVFVDRFLALARSRGVPVFWVIPPVHPEVQSRRARYGYDAGYESFVRGLADRHPNLVVVDGRRAGYPPEVLADMTHLNLPGALAFSDALGAIVDDRLKAPASPGPTWVDLPRWRAGVAERVAAAVEVEDLTRSAEGLKRLLADRKLAAGENRRRR